MISTTVIRTAFTSVVLAGCAAHPPPVPVSGSPADLQHLRGSWVGEYRDRDTGRAGSIYFSLEVGADTAHGDVVLTPAEGDEVHVVREESARQERPKPRAPQQLAITFVRIEGDQVEGRLDPYPDPDCGCMVETIFVGTVAADSLRGVYRSYLRSRTAPRRGEWHAVRIGQP